LRNLSTYQNTIREDCPPHEGEFRGCLVQQLVVQGQKRELNQQKGGVEQQLGGRHPSVYHACIVYYIMSVHTLCRRT
jgi:hypothetical protein